MNMLHQRHADCLMMLKFVVKLVAQECLAIVETLGFMLPSNLIFDWLLLLCVLLH
jgi:hypothetical protein